MKVQDTIDFFVDNRHDWMHMSCIWELNYDRWEKQFDGKYPYYAFSVESWRIEPVDRP